MPTSIRASTSAEVTSPMCFLLIDRGDYVTAHRERATVSLKLPFDMI